MNWEPLIQAAALVVTALLGLLVRVITKKLNIEMSATQAENIQVIIDRLVAAAEEAALRALKNGEGKVDKTEWVLAQARMVLPKASESMLRAAIDSALARTPNLGVTGEKTHKAV